MPGQASDVLTIEQISYSNDNSSDINSLFLVITTSSYIIIITSSS